MKITFLIQSLQFAGSEKVAIELIKHFRSKQIECSLIAIFQSGDPLGREKLIGQLQALEVDTIELNKNPGKDSFTTLLRLNRQIVRLRPDIIHSHGSIPNMYAGLRNLIFRKIPTMTTLHSGADDWSNTKARMIENISLLGVDRIVSVAEHVADLYQQKFVGSRGKISVIENGIDPSRFIPAGEQVKRQMRSRLNVGPGVRLLINVARIHPIKNQSYLVDVAACLKQRNGKFKMLLVGNLQDPEYASALCKKIDDLQLSNEIMLLGSREDVHELLQASDLFLFPSRLEAFGLALLEAMFAGLPALCSDIHANRRLAQYSPHNYVLTYDAALWAEKIEDILDRTDEPKGAIPQFVKQADYFTFERAANEYLDLCYRQIARTLPTKSSAQPF